MFGIKLRKEITELREEVELLKDPDYKHVYVLFEIQEDKSLKLEGSTVNRAWAVNWANEGESRCYRRQRERP